MHRQVGSPPEGSSSCKASCRSSSSWCAYLAWAFLALPFLPLTAAAAASCSFPDSLLCQSAALPASQLAGSLLRSVRELTDLACKSACCLAFFLAFSACLASASAAAVSSVARLAPEPCKSDPRTSHTAEQLRPAACAL